jgi:hypothetical protein
MPMTIIERPCLVCTKLTHRQKYCEVCAKDMKLKNVRKFNNNLRMVKVEGLDIEDVEYKKHYSKNFTWDQAHDPWWA